MSVTPAALSEYAGVLGLLPFKKKKELPTKQERKSLACNFCTEIPHLLRNFLQLLFSPRCLKNSQVAILVQFHNSFTEFSNHIVFFLGFSCQKKSLKASSENKRKRFKVWQLAGLPKTALFCEFSASR